MKKIGLLLALTFGLKLSAQTTLVNYNFNSASAYPVSPDASASSITGSLTSTEAFQIYAGTASGSQAFISNSTAGNAIAFSNSSGTNTKYWTLSLSGSSLSNYKAFEIYLQAQRSTTGAQTVTIAYSTDGSTFTNFSTTLSPPDGSYAQQVFDLSSINSLDYHGNVYFRIMASGASGTGTLRIDNLQVLGTEVITIAGPVGATGPTGPTGLTGATGPTGLTGATGANGSADAWSRTGNAGTTAGTNFIGTTDSVDFVIKTNGVEAARIKANGETNFTSLNLTTTNTSTFNGKIHALRPIEIGNSIWLGGNPASGTTNDIFTDAGDLLLQSSTSFNGNTIINANNNGKVVIGTPPASVTKKLEVVGDFRVGNGDGIHYIDIFHDAVNNVNIIDAAGGTPANSLPPTDLLINYYAHQTCNIGDGTLNATGPFNTFQNTHLATSSGNVGIGMSSNIAPFRKLTVNGDVSFANYNSTNAAATDGYNGIEILGGDGNGGAKIPTRRGISTDDDPNGDFNLFINSNEGPSTSFNFMNGISNPAKTLAKIDWAGHLFVYPDINNTNDAIDVLNGTDNVFNVKTDGTTRIGTMSHAGLLNVNGTIYAKEVKVTVNGWADYVFDEKYKLMPILDVEKYYKKFHHLPNIKSEEEMMKDGNSLAETDKMLMRQIEEQQLYIVELKKENMEMMKMFLELKKQIEELKQ